MSKQIAQVPELRMLLCLNEYRNTIEQCLAGRAGGSCCRCSYQFAEPAPPRQMIMATGSESGCYHAVGEHLKQGLQREGVDLKLVSTAGSRENMKLLTDPDGSVAIAFMQSGMEALGADPSQMPLIVFIQ